MAQDSEETPDKQRASDTEDLFAPLIEINRKAIARGLYSTAYHTLSAALYWAQNEKDVGRVQLIRDLAREQLVWIDTHAPEYKHSSQSARLRGNTNIFENLERRAEMILQMLLRERRYPSLRRIEPDAR